MNKMLSQSECAVRARARRQRRGTDTEAAAANFSRGLQSAIQLPLLEALEDNGGRGRPRDVYDQIAETLSIDQSALDATRHCGDGQSYKVFQQQVRWARQTAVAQGLIASGERGVWELTDKAYGRLGRIRRGVAILVYSTDDGIALWAHAEDAAGCIEKGSVNLVLTSPPYPVVKRSYGRFTVPEWLEWMRRLTGMWKDLITEDGTIALNLMDVFISGTPALSPYVERFTLAAIDDLGLHLAGRMMWHSPSKLGNIQWTAKEKHQPKNSLEHLLLFSKTPRPAWDLSRMDRGSYDGRVRNKSGKARRPSGYDINEDAFAPSEEGPLPGNLIIAGGAPGTDRYSRRCREEGIDAHPARYPTAVPRQIIQLTTAPGDLCYDPMAGSNTTGQVASELGRRFISSDPMLAYVHGSSFRFDQRSDFRSHLDVSTLSAA